VNAGNHPHQLSLAIHLRGLYASLGYLEVTLVESKHNYRRAPRRSRNWQQNRSAKNRGRRI